MIPAQPLPLSVSISFFIPTAPTSPLPHPQCHDVEFLAAYQGLQRPPECPLRDHFVKRMRRFIQAVRKGSRRSTDPLQTSDGNALMNAIQFLDRVHRCRRWNRNSRQLPKLRKSSFFAQRKLLARWQSVRIPQVPQLRFQIQNAGSSASSVGMITSIPTLLWTYSSRDQNAVSPLRGIRQHEHFMQKLGRVDSGVERIVSQTDDSRLGKSVTQGPNHRHTRSRIVRGIESGDCHRKRFSLIAPSTFQRP